MDALLDPQGSPPADPARRERVDAWLKVVAQGPAPAAPADLAARTLAAVQNAPLPFRHQDPAHAAGADTQHAPPGAWRRRLAEFGAMAIAAALLVAVTLQGLGQMQKSRMRVACAANLAKLSVAFTDYGYYCNGELPALALPANSNWLRGNTPLAARNNASNLIPMVNHNFVKRTAFYCPGAGLEAPPPKDVLLDELPPITYSYRNLFGREAVYWDGRNDTIVMSDRNPLFVPEAATTRNPDQKNSPNHHGLGNYLLRADGTVTWETNPDAGPGRDNIWTIESGGQRLLSYSGTESPPSARDVFLAP
jgi:hypothetical protein